MLNEVSKRLQRHSTLSRAKEMLNCCWIKVKTNLNLIQQALNALFKRPRHLIQQSVYWSKCWSLLHVNRPLVILFFFFARPNGCNILIVLISHPDLPRVRHFHIQWDLGTRLTSSNIVESNMYDVWWSLISIKISFVLRCQLQCCIRWYGLSIVERAHAHLDDFPGSVSMLRAFPAVWRTNKVWTT